MSAKAGPSARPAPSSEAGDPLVGALLEARRRAAAARERGEYRAHSEPPDVQEHGIWQAGRQLARWAVIEPDQAQVYSTRRLGAPITAFKRLLVRVLRQYLGQVTAQQTRFNAHAAVYVLALEDRIRELEDRLRRLEAAALNEPADPEAGP